jgi:beta-lactamase regulating signal transducer with metallopeptidase domain
VEEREQGEKEVVASRNNHLMNQTTTSWDNSTTIVWVVVAMQLIIFRFYVRRLRNYIDPPDNLPDNSLYRLSVESTQDYM